MRKRLLLALLAGVVLVWTAAGAGRLFSTYGYFSDTESSTGNVIQADTLDAPTALSANANGSSDTIDLTWTASADTYATGYEIFRRAPPSAYGSGTTYTEAQVLCDADTSCAFQDTGLTAGTQYCYKVRTTYLNWVSAFTTEDCDTTVFANPLLLSSPTATTNNLVESGASGGVTIKGHPDPTKAGSIVWSSVRENITVPTTANWAVTLELDVSHLQSATVLAEVWMVGAGSQCGTTPSGSVRASGSLVMYPSQTIWTVPLTATGPGSAQTGKLCLKITNTTADSGNSHYAEIITDGTAKLTGPFTWP